MYVHWTFEFNHYTLQLQLENLVVLVRHSHSPFKRTHEQGHAEMCKGKWTLLEPAGLCDAHWPLWSYFSVISRSKPQHVQQLDTIGVWQVPTQRKGQRHWVMQDPWWYNDQKNSTSVCLCLSVWPYGSIVLWGSLILQLALHHTKASQFSSLPGLPLSCYLPLNSHLYIIHY